MSKVAFVFGRIVPPTIGHEKLIEKLNSTPADEHIVFLSKSFDRKKNPLTFEDKLYFVTEFFQSKYPTIVFDEDESIRTPMDALEYLHKKGDAKEVILVVGSDRVQSFEDLLNKYNGKEQSNGSFYEFDSISVISAGDRDPDADGVEGMSASKMRQFAIDNDFEGFKQGIPDHVEEDTAHDLFILVQEGLKKPERKRKVKEGVFDLTSQDKCPECGHTLLDHTENPHTGERICPTSAEAKKLDAWRKDRIRNSEIGFLFETAKLKEGGAALQTARIPREYISHTMKVFADAVLSHIPHKEFAIVGSTGKKESSGDIDLAIDTALSLDQISEIVTDLGFRHKLTKGFLEVNIAFPQYNELGEQTEDEVQIDLMLTPLTWGSWMYYAPAPSETEWPGLYQKATLYALIRLTEETIDKNTKTGYSFAAAHGVFNYIKTKRLKKKRSGEMTAVWDKEYLPINGEKYSKDPELYCEVINSVTGSKFEPHDFTQPAELIWERIKQELSPGDLETFTKEINAFTDNQKMARASF